MNYPTKDMVELATHFQICKWNRFLPSPGMNHVDSPDFVKLMEEEVFIMHLIFERFREGGGFTPEISKAVGWEEPRC